MLRRPAKRPGGRSARLLITLPLVCLLAGSLASCRKARLQLKSGPSAIWLDTLGEPLRLQETEADAVARHALALSRGETNAVELPPRLARDSAPRMVFVSISDGSTPARVALGRGNGLGSAIADAASRLAGATPARSSSEGSSHGAGSQHAPRWLKLDIVTRVEPEAWARWGGPLAIEPSLQGIGFQRGSQLAFLPEELIGHRLVDGQGALRNHRVRARAIQRGLAPGAHTLLDHDGSFAVRGFSTQSFFFDGERAVPLFRGHRRDFPIDPPALRRAAALGASYLARRGRARRHVLVLV